MVTVESSLEHIIVYYSTGELRHQSKAGRKDSYNGPRVHLGGGGKEMILLSTY